MKILVVDDSKAMRMIVVRTLRQANYGGHQILEANNGAEALALIEKEKPELVLSDWNMPEMTGIQLLQVVREMEERPRFGFITSESNPEIRSQAEEAGAAFLLTKPFTAQSMQVVLDPVFAQIGA